MHALAFLLLLSLFQSPTSTPIQQQARKKLSQSHVPFTPEAFIESVIAGDKQKVEWFLDAGMSPDVTFKGEKYVHIGDLVISNGDPILVIAMILGHQDVVSLLLSHGADVNKPSSDSFSLLMLAKGDLVKTLLDKGADINWRGYGGNTALMDAVINGDLDKFKLLLDHGADINVKSHKGWTVIQIAAVTGQREAFTLLQARGADTSAFSARSLKLFLSDPDPKDEILRLIQRLRYVSVGNTIQGPSREEQWQVRQQLLEIAGRSAESRAQVIDRLMDVVEDLSAREEGPFATRWVLAVDLLGELKATEAVDVLVNNLLCTGQNGIFLPNFQPIRGALEEIGEPAVPKLVEALAHPNRYIRPEAAWVLYSIQKGRAKAAIQAAMERETDEEIKRAFKGVLDKIDGKY